MRRILTQDREEKPSIIFPSSLNFKILMAGVIGNGLEFYDFALFGVFSGVFANIFFQGDDFIALLKSLGLFAAGFIMRPLGSVFFGHIGDRLGRKKALAMFLGSWVMSPAMPQWGWRIPFWLGLTIALIGLYIRNQLEETPEYKNALQEKRIQKHPLKNMIKNNLKAFIGTIGIGGVNGIFAYTLVVFINLYLNKTVGVSVSNSMFYSCIGLSIFAVLAPVFGMMTDRYGAIRIMKGACLFSFFMSFPLFYLLYENTATSFSFAILLAALMMASFNAPTNYLLNTLFPVQARYSGIALGYAIGAAIFGGTAPLIYANYG
ncbi:MAG: MFS transporter [Chlamydiae bacterium]|nr:MFS transporter [Chlamydiota bacterium]